MAKAKRIKGIHTDCPACGLRLVIDEDTGEVAAYGEGKKADDPVDDPSPEDEQADDSKDESVEPDVPTGKTELEQDEEESDFARGNW